MCTVDEEATWPFPQLKIATRKNSYAIITDAMHEQMPMKVCNVTVS
jgi:hypothetical protein